MKMQTLAFILWLRQVEHELLRNMSRGQATVHLWKFKRGFAMYWKRTLANPLQATPVTMMGRLTKERG